MATVILDALAQVIEIDGIQYPVYTDFRGWMDLHHVISDKHASREAVGGAIEALFPKGVPSVEVQALGDALLDFLHNREREVKPPEEPVLMRDKVREEEEKEAAKKAPRIIDYEHDAGLILSAFWQSYGIDLSRASLHWHIFKALLDGLPDECKLRKIMGYRALDSSDYSSMGKEEGKRYRELQRIYALPDDRTQDEIDADFAASL